MQNKLICFLLTVCMVGFMSTGCASNGIECTPLVVTKYVNVEVPVTYKLNRPKRPVLKSQSLPIYVKELTSYTQVLENIIDKANKE